MDKTRLNPYIGRDGDARQLLEFYQKVLGGDLNLSTYGEAPMEAPESHKHRILHGQLEVSDHVQIMASDAPPNMPVSTDDATVSLSLSGPDEAGLRKVFDQLAEGGKVVMPLEKQFWGDLFGMVDDKFNMHWMVNIGEPQSAKDAKAKDAKKD
jgi:PhnB protein